MERTRIFKGDSKTGNKQLFRHLRLKGSPTLKHALRKVQGNRRKEYTCSKCGETGHQKHMRVCSRFYEDDAENTVDNDEDDTENTVDNDDDDREFSDEIETEESADETQESIPEEESSDNDDFDE